ncbi:MAG TPA: hypothetical protein VKZ42_02645 [Flavobacteriaceae bacterium]|nr:hypothetical protein [Flavobacteriaceae bacterium]
MVIHKAIKYAMIILAVIAAIFAFMIMFADSTPSISSLLYIGYIALALGLFFILLFSITNTFSSREILKKTLISLGLLVLVVIIAFVISSGEAVVKNGVEIVSASASKRIDVGLKVFYILAIVSVLSIVFSGFKKYAK